MNYEKKGSGRIRLCCFNKKNQNFSHFKMASTFGVRVLFLPEVLVGVGAFILTVRCEELLT